MLKKKALALLVGMSMVAAMTAGCGGSKETAATEKATEKKTEVATLRVRDIHPDIRVTTWNLFFDESTLPNFDFSSYSYVVDAIDTVGSKILLAQRCYEAGVPELCCLGTGNKREPSRFCVEDLA